MLVMEDEQRKLQSAWGGNTEEKNCKLNMEEQVSAAAAHIFSNYWKYCSSLKWQ